MSVYTALVSWSRAPGERFVDRRYSRRHEWSFDGGFVAPASASPQIVATPYADPAAIDPEEALVAALSSCHMLFFLDYAARSGFAIASYRDQAVGTTGKRGDGRDWIAEVTLRPNIVFDGERRPSPEEVAALHDRAHQSCFIANSFRGEVKIEAG